MNPFLDAAPDEVPLPDAPLISVVAQVRFAPLLKINEWEHVTPFQEAIRKRFPLLQNHESTHVFFPTPDGSKSSPTMIWRFFSADRSWTLSLSPTFMALETKAYTSRDDFMERFTEVLDVLQEHLAPDLVLRVGLRYVDRLNEEHLADLRTLVCPEMLGVLNTALSEQTLLSLQESLFQLPQENALLRARWGLMPSNATPDPSGIPEVPTPSWILDLDVFSDQQRAFAPQEIVETLRSYAERTYTVFRWAVTDAFLKRFGGEL